MRLSAEGKASAKALRQHWAWQVLGTQTESKGVDGRKWDQRHQQGQDTLALIHAHLQITSGHGLSSDILGAHHHNDFVPCWNAEGLQPREVWLRTFDFMMVWKWCTFGRSSTSKFEFWSFPRLTKCDPIPPGDAGERHLSQPATMRVNHRHIYNHSVPRHPFCCSFSVPYSVKYMRLSTLDCKIHFVLDGFAQW